MAEMKVALTAVDGISGPVKQATASVNAFGSTANSVGQQTTAAFEKMNSSVGAVVGKMNSFASAITGVAIGAFVSNILQSSDAIKDLSESFGVTVEKILEIEAGFSRAGRSTEQMGLALATFEASLQEAQNGSAKAQAELAKLGLTEEFRRSHTSLESFNKMMETVAGSAGDAEIKVAAVGVAGRGMKTISAQDFVEGFKNAQGTLSGLAANTILAADTQKKLEQSLKDVRNAFLNLIAPALEFLEAIIGRGGSATIIATGLGIALVGLVSSAVITGFNTLLALFTSLAGAMGLNTAATTLAVGATNALTTAELNYIIVKRAEFAAKVASLQATIAENNARLIAIGTARAGTVAEAQMFAARRALGLATGQLSTAQAGLAGTTAAVTAATGLGTAATATATTTTGIFARAAGILTGALLSLQVVLFRIGAVFIGVAAALAAPAWAVITAGVVAIGVAVSAVTILWKAFGDEITEAFDIGWTAVKDFGSKTLDYLNGVFDKLANGLRKALGQPIKPTFLPQSEVDSENKRLLARGKSGQAPGTGTAAADKKPFLAGEESLRQQFALQKLTNEQALQRLDIERKFIGLSEAARNGALANFDAQVKAKTDLLKITQEIAVLEITMQQGDAATNLANQGKLQILKQQRDIIAATKEDQGILAKSSLEQAQIQSKNNNILRDAGIAARQQVDDFIHGNTQITDRISLETQLMGLGRDQAQLESARADLTQRTSDKVRDLNLEMAKLKVLTAAEDPNAAAKIKFLEDTQKNIILQASLDQKFLAQNIQGQQKKRTALEAQLFVNDLINSAQSEAISLANEFAKLSLGTDQQRIADIQTQNSLLAQQQILKESALLGVDAEGKQIIIGLERQLAIRKEIDAKGAGNLAQVQAIQETTRQIERQKFLQEIKNTIATDAINLENTINKLYMSGDQQRIADIKTQNTLLAEQQILKESAALGVDAEGRQRIINLERQQQIRNEMATKTNIDVAGLEVVQKTTNQLERQKFIQDLLNSNSLSAITLQTDLAKLTMSSDQQKIADIMSQNALLAQQRILKESMELGLDAEGNQQTISLERQLQIKKEIAAANDILITGAQSLIDKGREFNTGWTQAFEQYRSDAENAAAQSKTYFDTFTKGFEDAFVKLVQTGKLSFKDLANSLIADFARIQARKALTGVFDMGGGDSKGNGFSFGTLLSSIGGLFKANGGQVQGDSPYIVGERGPELFVPQSAGKIIPNNALGGSSSNTVNNTAVTYSIQAVDASSFRALLARDPEFIHNVAEQGRRSLPIRSRR